STATPAKCPVATVLGLSNSTSASLLEAVRQSDRERAETLRAGETNRPIPRPAQYRREERQLPQTCRRRDRPRRTPVTQHPLPRLRHPRPIHPTLPRLLGPPRLLSDRDRPAQRTLRTLIARRTHQPHQPSRRDPTARLLHP